MNHQNGEPNNGAIHYFYDLRQFGFHRNRSEILPPLNGIYFDYQSCSQYIFESILIPYLSDGDDGHLGNQ